jgi:hypothetical protein
LGLSTALTRLNRDRSVDGVVRDLLLFFRHHPRESFTAADVARRTGHPAPLIEPILLTLSQCFVLDFQSDLAVYRYMPDAVLEFDVDRFLLTVGTVQGRLQDNVARFRQRHTSY